MIDRSGLGTGDWGWLDGWIRHWRVEIGDTIEIHRDSFRYAGNTSERLGIGEWGLPTVYYRKRRGELAG
jgi:hypothetical protein